MQFESVPPSQVEPCDNDNLLTDRDSLQALGGGRNDFQPSVRRAFMPLFGGLGAAFERGLNETYGL
jgi:hypothetical protein